MTAAVLTPFTAGQAVELGNRVWRKKLLPIGNVEYKGRTLRFTKDYLGQIVDAFQNRAYDQVPFQLADAENRHSNDPERTRGEIRDMQLGDDGLYITAELTPEGEAVLTANPKLGVSARIVEDYARSDGQFFKSAVQHVLGTLDPRIPGLGAWEAIEAASPAPETVLDLSAESFTDPAPAKEQKKAVKAAERQTEPASDPAGADPEGGAPVADLSSLDDEQKARLAKLLALPDDALAALAAGGAVLTPEELDALTAPDESDGELSDAELDELVAAAEQLGEAGLLGDEEEDAPDYTPEQEREPVAAGLSAEAQFAIDLANARSEETQRELAAVTSRLREQDYEAEKRRLADLGVPPRITEMARPLLEGAGRTVELANGRTADAGQIVRQVLTEYAAMARLLDLDVELGSPMDEPEAAGREETARSRQALVNDFKSMTGL